MSISSRLRIAEPEKALVDFIYFKNYRYNKFNPAKERLDKDMISSLHKRKLRKYPCRYNKIIKILIICLALL